MTRPVLSLVDPLEDPLVRERRQRAEERRHHEASRSSLLFSAFLLAMILGVSMFMIGYLYGISMDHSTARTGSASCPR